MKVLKRTLKLAINPGVILTYPEFVTLIARVSYRPLGLVGVSGSSQQEDHIQPLTPKMMLIGKSSNFSPPLQYSADDRFCTHKASLCESGREGLVGQMDSTGMADFIQLYKV